MFTEQLLAWLARELAQDGLQGLAVERQPLCPAATTTLAAL